jgi:hypothetical protein
VFAGWNDGCCSTFAKKKLRGMVKPTDLRISVGATRPLLDFIYCRRLCFAAHQETQNFASNQN